MDAYPTLPKGGTTHGIKFPSPREASIFREAFTARAFRYQPADGASEIILRVKPALPPDQRARGALLHPIYSFVDKGEFAGKVKPYYPKGSRPITVLAVAKDDGSLLDLARIEFSAGSDNVKIESVELASVIAGNLETLTKIADASGVRPSVVPEESDDLR